MSFTLSAGWVFFFWVQGNFHFYLSRRPAENNFMWTGVWRCVSTVCRLFIFCWLQRAKWMMIVIMKSSTNSFNVAIRLISRLPFEMLLRLFFALFHLALLLEVWVYEIVDCYNFNIFECDLHSQSSTARVSESHDSTQISLKVANIVFLTMKEHSYIPSRRAWL